ncbi:MAG: hydratase [Lachnospiraceae bacterium]|nr:hydratase [Lachnospiraceae bacterium]
MKLYDHGVYLIGGRTLADEAPLSKVEAKKGTIAYGILKDHNTSGSMEQLRIKFDALTSHDITYVGIIQTARASGLERFPIPYVLTNCHNSLCAVGGTINEDDHVFGLTAAKKYGGVYVPPMQAVIHQYAREMLSGGGRMILGSDSHTRYGAMGTMAMGEGGPELVKQLLNRTYDIAMPEVVAVYLKGEVQPGTGPQDIALAIIGAVFKNGYVKNKVMEFVGPGVAGLSMDYRIGVDVMTTETTCLSSVWETDARTEEYFAIHGRPDAYKALTPAATAYYDGCIEIDLSEIKPMIAMPYHPSCVYTIDEVNDHPYEILKEAEERAKVSFGDKVSVDLQGKVRDGRLCVDQGIIAGCAGGGFENLCDAADILRGKSIGSGAFSLSVYPASMPVYRELMKNGSMADLIDAGAVVKPAFCGPCFGAGDTPSNNAFSIRHSTRNFPNREGSKVQEGQISSVALMDARSIAATAANQGKLTSAAEYAGEYTKPAYYFDSGIYKNRVFDSHGEADPSAELVYGPNIKDWPQMPALADNLLLKVVSEIHDPVTTTDELIPSGETSSYRSNPLKLASFALSRKDPAYVGRAQEVQKAENAVLAGNAPAAVLPELESVMETVKAELGIDLSAFAAEAASVAAADASAVYEPLKLGIGSTIFAVKPGDGSAREQAASCQKVLGGWANIANEYATKRYRSNLINWGMLPLLIQEGELPFANGDWIFVPDIAAAVAEKRPEIQAYAVRDGKAAAFTMTLGDLTDDEREIIGNGCLINYYRKH